MSSPIAAIVDKAIDVGTNIYSARQAEENQRRDHRQQDRHAKQKYQWMMADMKAAGLNPILAAGGGTPGASGGGGGAAGGVHGSNLSSSTSARQLMNLTKKQLEADIDLKGEQATATGFQGLKTASEAVTAREQSEMSYRQNQFYKKYPWLQHIEQSPNTLNSARDLLKIPADYLKAVKPFGKK
ncbi:DNA pilot protein [Microviridae sp.]|nr:DNA pilot protein [Microviridae sp.]